MAADLGSNAPDFTLPNQDRQAVTLSEELKKGPVVLAFFPAAFSGTCTKQMCTFRDSNAELRATSARVLGVSVDTFFALKAFADAQHLDFPLLSDFNSGACSRKCFSRVGCWALGVCLFCRTLRSRIQKQSNG